MLHFVKNLLIFIVLIVIILLSGYVLTIGNSINQTIIIIRLNKQSSVNDIFQMISHRILEKQNLKH
jgi:hypothetical protein